MKIGIKKEGSKQNRSLDVIRVIDIFLLSTLLILVVWARTEGAYTKEIYVEVCNGQLQNGSVIDVTKLNPVISSEADLKCKEKGYDSGWFDSKDCTNIKCYRKTDNNSLEYDCI